MAGEGRFCAALNNGSHMRAEMCSQTQPSAFCHRLWSATVRTHKMRRTEHLRLPKGRNAEPLSKPLSRKLIKQLAKSSFQAKQNPLDAALYYMAMKKKTVLAALFRSVNDKRMSDFFQNDFSQDRWRKAALKNAYVLLGKQQFEYAAAFFLLANAVKDAVQVCLSKLEDLQLAMVVVRLYEGDLDSVPEHLRRLLDAEVLGQPEGAEGPSMELAHPDPFLRSMALWLLQRYEESLTTLLQTRVGQEHHRIHQETQHLSSSAAGQAANASDKASVSGPPAADDTGECSDSM
ncbi:hypothetical protein HPB49_017997 [Dermacentor silvarum]|uniref:Uncharacterized protein n=1 Tax=Dermacentor silvarum TaxID=543639 RepID=A0ACB8CZ14_DERSI|nr:hypothetical protein HPB49_017997 [Dermacentor silvarum]